MENYVVKIRPLTGGKLLAVANVKDSNGAWYNGFRVFMSKFADELVVGMPSRLCTDGKYRITFNPPLEQANLIKDAIIKAFLAIKPIKFEDKAIEIHKFLHGNVSKFEGIEVKTTSKSKVRFIEYKGYRFIIQNPNKKDSKYFEAVKNGRKISWILLNGEFVAKIMDDKFENLTNSELRFL